MEILVKELPDCLRKVYAYATPEEVNRCYQYAFEAIQENVEFPGFRKGKVPYEIIEKNFSDKLYNEVFFNLIALALSDIDKTRIVNEITRFKPLSELKRDKDFSFYLEFVEDPRLLNDINFDNLTLEYEEYFYDEKMIKDYISEILKEYEESEGKIEEKDKVSLKLVNSNGEEFDPIDIIALEMPSLLGKKKGDEVEASYYDIENYLGIFFGKVKEPLKFLIVSVKKPKKQPLTDEYIATRTSFKTLEEYKSDIAKAWDKEIENLNNKSKRDSIRNFIAKNIKIEFSKSEFLNFLASRFYRFFKENLSDTSIDIKSLIDKKQLKEKYDSLLYNYYEEYLSFIGLFLIAKKLNIEADKTYSEYIILDKAMKQGITAEEVKAKLTKEEKEEIEMFSLIQTVLDHLVKKIKFKPKNKIPYPSL